MQKNLLSSHSIVSKFNNDARDTLLNGPIFNLLFCYHIFLYWKKVTSYENFSLPLEIFSYSILLMKVSKYWKIAEFLKISIEIKNRKTSYKAQTVRHLRKFFSVPPPHIPPDKILLRLRNKIFLRERYRNMQTFSFKVLRESSSWMSGNGAVQIFFSDNKQKHVCWKICELRKFFGCVLGACYFQCQESWGS